MTARDRTKADYWRRMLRGQGGSGLSVRAWCRRHDLSEASFYWWRRQLARRDARARPARPRRSSGPAFVPVRVAADPAGAANGRPGCIEIILSGERRIRVFGAVDPQALAVVLAVLNSGDADPGPGNAGAGSRNGHIGTGRAGAGSHRAVADAEAAAC